MVIVIQCETIRRRDVGVQEEGDGLNTVARWGRITLIPRTVSEQGRTSRPLTAIPKPSRRKVLPRRVGVGPGLWNLEKVVIRDIIGMISDL